MKKVALLCVAALCLAACHCERKTTGTPCRKAACTCKHAQVKKDCTCHKVHMGALQQTCSCKTSCELAKTAPKVQPTPVKPAPVKVVEPSAALSSLGTVKTQGNKIFLNYKEPIRFANDSDVIENDSYKQLDETAQILKKFPQTKITVKGYSDSIGNPAYNVALSQRRAKAVANALIARGVKAENVTAVGYGAANPIASNQTAEGRRLNRRVELELETK